MADVAAITNVRTAKLRNVFVRIFGLPASGYYGRTAGSQNAWEWVSTCELVFPGAASCIHRLAHEFELLRRDTERRGDADAL